jgi:hypothetical protein
MPGLNPSNRRSLQIEAIDGPAFFIERNLFENPASPTGSSPRPGLPDAVAHHCEGDIRAQLVWQESCCEEQLLRHDWLAVVVLLLESGVPVAADELIGAVGGTTQVV